MVVMDKQDYMDKAFTLLSDTSTYKLFKGPHHQAWEFTYHQTEGHQTTRWT